MKRFYKALFNKINKRYNDNRTSEIEFDIIKSYAYRADKKEIVEYAFQDYIYQLEENKELVQSIDNKILKALEIMPSI